jgi:hypothetical protein
MKLKGTLPSEEISVLRRSRPGLIARKSGTATTASRHATAASDCLALVIIENREVRSAVRSAFATLVTVSTTVSEPSPNIDYRRPQNLQRTLTMPLTSEAYD